MQNCRAAAFAVLLTLTLPNPLWAEQVTLSSRSGNVEVSGNLLSFDGEFYRIESEYGILTVDGSGVECSGTGCPDLSTYVAEARIATAHTVGASLLPALVETFAARNGYLLERIVSADRTFRYELAEPDTARVVGRLYFQLMSSTDAIAAFASDQAEIAVTLREMSRSEVEIASEDGTLRNNAARSRILGLDGLIPIVSVSNPAKEMTLEDLAGILKGEIQDWVQVTGETDPLTLHIGEADSGYVQTLEGRLLDGAEITAPNIIRHQSDAALSDAVADDPFALGVVPFSEVGNAQPLDLKDSCGTISVAEAQSLKTEDYPLTAPIFLYATPRRLPKLVRDFLAFARSPAAQPIVERAGFVDQFPAAIPLAAQGERLANAILQAGPEINLAELRRMVAAMTGRNRLSITFRFEDGSSQLDAQSRSNISLLAEAMERGVFDRRTLIFMGFSDGLGPAIANRKLAQDRAETVRAAVSRAAKTIDPDQITLKVDSFGEALPMACDDSEWGRSVNRRVEVWLE